MNSASAAGALSELRDIHLPDPVSFWPLAPGWWGLILGILFALTLAAWVWHQHRSSARRAALVEVERLESEYAISHDAGALASGLSALLRRLALLAGERVRVASLHGVSRAHALDEGSANFSPRLLEGIESAVYRGPDHSVAGEDIHAWFDAVRGFIRRTT